MSGRPINVAEHFHGSMERLEVGVILAPRGAAYEADWGKTDFYSVLEANRPTGSRSHKDSVFLCSNDDDLDAAGGGTDWVFRVSSSCHIC